jgi:hypothetical protein
MAVYDPTVTKRVFALQQLSSEFCRGYVDRTAILISGILTQSEQFLDAITNDVGRV